MQRCRNIGRVRRPAAFSCIAVCRVAVCHAVLSSLVQADEVVVQASTARSRITITGEILEYNGRFLVIQTGTGTGQQRYSAAEVVSVKTSYTSAHTAGLRLFKAGKGELALREFETAVSQEPRTWVRRDILALLIRCALRADDFATAGSRFKMLYESDPDSPQIAVIPLYWSNKPARGAARLQAVKWLTDEQFVMRLVGASLLMFDPEYAESARDTMKELRRAPGEQIREFAWWQQWRLSIHSKEVSDFDIERWEDRIVGIAPVMRAGPYFVLGQGYLVRQDFDLAAAAFLQLPLVYQSDHPITGQACFEAGQSLARIGQTEEAARLYREVIDRFHWTPAARSAESLLNRSPEADTP